MKKTKIRLIMHIVLIILSVIVLVLAFLAGIDVIDRGTPTSNGMIFFAMILNIISNAIMLNRSAKNYLNEKDKM